MACFSSKVIGTNVCDLFTDTEERFRYQERIRNSSKGVGKFWRFAECIFLTSADGFELDSFRLSHESRNDDITNGARFKRDLRPHPFPSPVLELLHVQDETVLVVCTNGSVLTHELDEIGGGWREAKAITTLASHLDADLVSVELHRGHGALYWCETSKGHCTSDRWSFNVFKKSVYVAVGPKRSVTFGEMVSILRNCPPTNLLCLKDHVLFWFSECFGRHRDRCPPGLYLTVAADGSMTTRVFGCETDLRPSLTNEFMNHCIQFLNVWSGSSIPPSNVVHVDRATDCGLLIVVTNDGKASVTKQNGEVVTRYDLPELDVTDLTYFVMEDVLCIAGGNELVSSRLEGPTSSWNTLEVAVSSVFRCENVSAVYVRSEEDVYRWTTKDVVDVSPKPDDSVLSSWNEAYYKRIFPLDGFEQIPMLKPPIVYSEGLPLTLIERCLEGNASPMVSKAAAQHLKTIRKIKTDSDLDNTIRPLVDAYFNLRDHLGSERMN